MAIPVNIEDLINKRVVESTRIEFKSDFNPNAIIHSICAFANDIDNLGGGYIVIGVEEENGSPVFPVKGIEQSRIDNILKDLVGYCHCIEPLYNPVAEPVMYGDVYVIVIWVSGGYGRPYKASKDVFGKEAPKSSKYYYIRKFSSTIIASPEEEKELFYISTDIPFDDRPNLAADVDDLDIGLMRNHLKEIGSTLYERSKKMSLLEIASDMQLVSGPVEHIKPLNVGILMFSEQPEKYFRYARIEVVDIPDPTGNNMVEKVFTGPIQRQLKDALAYIKNYTVKEVIIKEKSKAEAVKIYNYPYAAIEEILSNAVYHRSYQINEPITVRITPQSIEITSFPGFDRSISDESIANYSIRARIYRNRRIGDFLKELRLIEGRNTGFPNAIKALTENGSDLLSFDMDDNRSYLSVTIPVHSYFTDSKGRNDKKVLYEKKIIDALKNAPLTMTELAAAMGYKGITRKLKDTVNEMLGRKEIFKVAGEGNAIKLYITDKK
ncbi:MAG: putative DNA binding domain-containing protein [Oscillospiraceae bacterium]|nr:putative DNA binding domain-containing protein [Oscillospiraceae bacterium]